MTVDPDLPIEDILCPHCGKRNKPGQRQCSNCGFELAEARATTRGQNAPAHPQNVICLACQHRNRPGSRFCALCGASLLEPARHTPTPVELSSRPGRAVQPVPAAPQVSPQNQVNCPRCLLPNPANAGVCVYCGYGSLPVSAVTGIAASRSTATPPFAAQFSLDQTVPVEESMAYGNTGRACPACGTVNLETAMQCKSCGYSFTYRQEVDERPYKPFKNIELIGFIVFFIIFIILIGLVSYYWFIA